MRREGAGFIIILSIFLLFLLLLLALAPAAGAFSEGEGERDAFQNICPAGRCGDGDEDMPSPQIRFSSPEDGGSIRGIASFSWEVLFFDVSDGYVTIEVCTQSPSKITNPATPCGPQLQPRDAK